MFEKLEFKENLLKLFSIDHFRVFHFKNDNKLYLKLKELDIVFSNKNLSKACILYDIHAGVQVVIEKGDFLDNFEELSVKRKEDFYSQAQKIFRYRMVYCFKENKISIQEYNMKRNKFLYKICQVSANPISRIEDIQDKFLLSLEMIENALSLPVLVKIA